MKKNSTTPFFVCGFLLAAQICVAQIKETEHTLKLDPSAPRPKATLSDVSLLIGHWQGDMFGSKAEELWLPPAGGSMMGVFRLYDDKKVILYEFMTMIEEEGSVSLKLKHFHSSLVGWEERDKMVTFRLVKANPDGIWFEGMTFLRMADGSLQGYIATTDKEGKTTEDTFIYRAVATR